MGVLKYIIVTDKQNLFQDNEDWLVLSPSEFIGKVHLPAAHGKAPRVINLSSRYDYLNKGYYVSLLSEARGMPCIPDVSNVITLNWRRNYDFFFPELNQILAKCYDLPFEEPLSRTYTSFFGRHSDPKIEPVARRIFDLFRFPIISFELKYSQSGKWVINKIETPSFNSLADRQIEIFHQDLATFTGSAWRHHSKNKKSERYWIAILQDPKEKNAPSNQAALKKFISVGKKMNLWVELISKQDFSTLLEFDALFIRETTAINNHTYRFASKAEQEDIPCIDDTHSIIRCCNKVYLQEILESHHIPVPKTVILDKRNIGALPDQIEFPVILKIPDSSFSRGIYKVSNREELKEKTASLFQKSEIILAQEYIPSAFDWRIGVLNNKALFASKYFMAKDHWQIYNHDAKNKGLQSGDDEAVALKDVPENIITTALAAAKLIGDGFYGVDLKQLEDGRVVVIEVNDNPNIDSGVEDKILGDELYRRILEYLVTLIEK